MPDTARKRMVARRLLGGGAFALGSRVFSAVVAFIVGVILARLLDPGSFGSYALAMSVVSLMAVIGGLGVDQAVVRLVSSANAHGESGTAYARRGLAIAGVGGLIVGIIVLFSARWVFDGAIDAPLLAQNAFLMALWCFFLTLQRQLSETYRANHEILRAELFAGLGRTGVLSGSLFLLAIGVANSFGPLDFRTAVICVLTSVVFTVVVAFAFLNKRIDIVDSPPDAVTKKIMTIAIPLGLATFMLLLQGQVDVWLVAVTTGTQDTALYTAALRLAVLVQMPTFIVTAVVPPMIAELYSMRDTSLMEPLVRSVATVASIPAAMLWLVLVFFSEPLLNLLYGEFYGDAATILILLTTAHFCAVLSGPAAIGLAMTGGERTLLTIAIIGVIFSVVAGYVGGLHYGAQGVATVSATALILQSIAMAVFFRRRLGIWPVATLSPRRLMVLGQHFRRESPSAGKAD